MIIWINGPFGVGKTSVARRLVKSLDRVRLVDPERIGFMLRKTWPKRVCPDFQDLPAWRQMTLDLVTEASASWRTVVVPMTLANPAYHDEIIGGLRRRGVEVHHVTLMAPATTLKRRIWRRLSGPGSKRWELARVAPTLAMLSRPEFAIHVDTDGRKIADIAREVLARIGEHEVPDDNRRLLFPASGY